MNPLLIGCGTIAFIALFPITFPVLVITFLVHVILRANSEVKNQEKKNATNSGLQASISDESKQDWDN